ncbi:WXG100 family type VII secretion target [Paenibacillus sp. FSL R7-0272]|uniref:WXG100 family type VII secretion target n=1 Tax=Paenibacillus sp. FSL R7-0272 TaxID=2921679 RepID=UPI0030ED8387
MSTIKVTPEQLHHVSNQVNQARQQLEHIQDNLSRQIMFLQAVWLGVTQERFYGDFARSRTVLQKALESMLYTSKELTDIATRFEQADAEKGSLGGVIGAVGAAAMMKSSGNDAGSEDKGYRMAQVNVYGRLMWMPVNENGVPDQASLQAYQKDQGHVDINRMQAGHAEDPGEDLNALQIEAFENGVHPFTGEPVNDRYAQMMVTSLKFSQIFMAFQMVRGSMPGRKGPFRLPSSHPAVVKMKKNLEDHKARKEGGQKDNSRKGVNPEHIEVPSSTQPSGKKGGLPEGNYATGKDRGWIKQNESADTFAKEGYHVKMLDEIEGGNGHGIKEGSNPDFLIEGKVFDHYAPISTKSANGIAEEIKRKTKDQADRIILNLDGFTEARVAEVSQKIIGKTNPNGDLRRLKELFIIREGKIEHLFWRE